MQLSQSNRIGFRRGGQRHPQLYMTVNLINPTVNGPISCLSVSKNRAASSFCSSRRPCTCQLPAFRRESWTDKALHGTAAALVSLSLFSGAPALADLNKFEAAAGGEFGVGTAAQYGEAELRGKDFSGQVHFFAYNLILVSISQQQCRKHCKCNSHL